MKKSELHLPHFLRFTRALALVSGMAVPAAVATACGGEVFGHYDGQEMGSVGCEGACGVQNDGDGAPGVRDGGEVYDGQPMGTVAYDGGPVGVAPYDGGPVGVAPYDSGIGDAAGGGVSFPPDAADDVSMGGGGPLVAPELPA